MTFALGFVAGFVSCLIVSVALLWAVYETFEDEP